MGLRHGRRVAPPQPRARPACPARSPHARRYRHQRRRPRLPRQQAVLEGVMHTAFFRDGDALIAPEPVASITGMRAILARLLEELVHANAEPLRWNGRELPPEWFHYPLP